MSAVEIDASSAPTSRVSCGAVQGGTASTVVLDARERTQAGYYNGYTLVITSGTMSGASGTISNYEGGNFYADLAAPLSGSVPPGSDYEIHAPGGPSGQFWRLEPAQWLSAIGNGSGGGIALQYDASPNHDWSQPVTVKTWAPPGTPGQNGNDAEEVSYAQVYKRVSGNTLRNPPRPQDGNLLEPPGSHTGTDASPLDVGPEVVDQRTGTAPIGSTIATYHADGPDANDNDAIYTWAFTRIACNTPGSIAGEYVLQPVGDLPYVFGGVGGGLWVQDNAGILKPQGQGTINVMGVYQQNVPLQQTGTWLPTLQGSATPGQNTYSIQSGEWQRNGNMVTAWGRVSLSAKDPNMAGNIQIGNLPFPASATASLNYSGNVSETGGIALPPGYTQLMVEVIAGSGAAQFVAGGSNLSATTFGPANIASNATLIFTFSYRVG